MSTSLSMMVTSTSRASSDWLTTWPKRPNPIISTLPDCPEAGSTPSIDAARRRLAPRVARIAKGVSAIDSTTTAVIALLTSPGITPADCAAEYSTNANSPPWAISTARSIASAWPARSTRATA